ncbi:MAG: sigma-54-dependent Fis family transcriptional regulator [Planctomycetaceae bacterium]|nr:sigma-54-dependent Fis family transcriptional regulator [Planctomycetaceae bacterium]
MTDTTHDHNTKPARRPAGTPLRLLFADDEQSLQELMRLELPRMGHEVTVCPDGEKAMAALELNTYDCILVDLDMPGRNGIEVIAKAKEMAPETDAIVLTGKSSLESAVAALRYGAFDYLTKPCKLIELRAILQRVAEKRELTKKYLALKQRLERLEGRSDLVGDSRGMSGVRQLLSKVAPTDSTILILGETGTGKELVARALHDQSLRADKPFVPINCGALPENLIESELFGHRKGAFTGADEHRVGLFEVADGGTLFLDEIGELPKAMQAKLLRFLESGEVRRVGDNEPFTCNVRVVCATHRHLDEMVKNQEFREDLWYRINTFEIHLPPLRDRIDDIPLLAYHLARRYRSCISENTVIFAPETLRLLKSHGWPGNVRELANVVEHAMILADELPILPEHLPSRFGSPSVLARDPVSDEPCTLRELEMQAICAALERHNGNKPLVAEELGISLKTLYNKLNQTTTLKKSA